VTTVTLPLDDTKQLEQTIHAQQEVIATLQAQLNDCCPTEECPEPEPPAPADCDTEYLLHVYEQATCDREDLEKCQRMLCSPVVQNAFCMHGCEQLWLDLKKLADIEIAVACAHEAEAYFDYVSCVAQHKVECRQQLCESIVTTAECKPGLDKKLVWYVQKLTGKCINW
jgi:hypothetical protein